MKNIPSFEKNQLHFCMHDPMASKGILSYCNIKDYCSWNFIMLLLQITVAYFELNCWGKLFKFITHNVLLATHLNVIIIYAQDISIHLLSNAAMLGYLACHSFV